MTGKRLGGLAAALLCCGIATTAIAQPTEVGAMIEFVGQKPQDMDKAEWKEKRREVARKLVASKEKRVLPALQKLAEQETFDIIGEIAIEGLGTLGDTSAIPLLQKIAVDSSRDKKQRDLATKALAKLGAKTTKEPGPTKEIPPEPGTTDTIPPPVEPDPPPTGGNSGDPPPTELPPLDKSPPLGSIDPLSPNQPRAAKELPSDALFASERFAVTLSSATIGYDSVRKRSSVNLDVGGNWSRRIDREQWMTNFVGTGRIVGGHLKNGNEDNDTRSRGVQATVFGSAEARFYSAAGVYGVGRGAILSNFSYLSIVPNNGGNAVRDGRTALDIGVAIGGGYGRVLDIGSRLRVKRIEQVLSANRALGKAIPDDVSSQLQRTWWAYRNSRNAHDLLIATIAVLRTAGVILGEPDPSLTYQLLNVLRDGQYQQRMQGFDIDLTFGESYLIRDDAPNNPMVAKGRIEQLLVRAGYGRQMANNFEITGGATARYRILSPENTPAPWAVSASVGTRRFSYGPYGDPIGTLDATATLGLSSDDRDATSVGSLVGVEVGYTYWLNQASGFRLAANATLEAGAVFFGAKLEGRYGLLDAAFAR